MKCNSKIQNIISSTSPFLTVELLFFSLMKTSVSSNSQTNFWTFLPSCRAKSTSMWLVIVRFIHFMQEDIADVSIFLEVSGNVSHPLTIKGFSILVDGRSEEN